jgi:hypothetical protein
MTRKEQIELAKEWEALGKRMRILKDELEPLGLRRAEIEDGFDSDIEGTTLYQVLDDEEEGPQFSAVIHALAEKYPGAVDYEAKADVFDLLDVNNNVIGTISDREMDHTLNLLGEETEPQEGGPVSLRGIELAEDEEDDED